jgi:hypothetical protein
MSIEFPCSQCGKLLRVGDDAAGKQARCPSCGAVQEIPSAQHGSLGPLGAAASAPMMPSALPASDNPYQAPASVPWYPEQEGPFGRVPQGPLKPSPIDAGNILSRTWAIFQGQFWMMVLVGFILAICEGGIGAVIGQVVSLSMLAGRGGEPTPADLVIIQVVIRLLALLVNTWLELGMAVYMLKIARGQPASLGDLFTAARFWPAAIAMRLLAALAILSGLLLFIIPGIILGLMFSQALFLIVDRGMGPIEAMSMSRTVTSGNKAQIFILNLAGFGVMLVGVLACCVGTWPAMSFIWLMSAMAYLTMTGQPTTDESFRQPPLASPFAGTSEGGLR